MNIGTDKDDLFRNSVPGYVFIVVIMSFYALIGRLTVIADTAQAILTLVAGFPLGFIFYYIYRFVHIKVPFRFLSAKGKAWMSEQRHMEKQEADLIMKKLKTRSESLELDISEEVKNRDLSQLFELYLCKPENEGFRARNHSLIMRVHALSGSIVAILAALITILFKYSQWELLALRNIFGWTHSLFCEVKLLFFAW